MQNKGWFAPVWAFAVIGWITLCSLYCLVGAYAPGAKGLVPVALWCLGGGAVFAWVNSLKRGWPGWVALGAALGLACLDGSLFASSHTLVLLIGDVPQIQPTALTGALCLWGTVCLFFGSRCVCRQQRLWGILPVCVPAILCFWGPEMPGALWLLGFLTGLGLLILTQGLRRRVLKDGNRLVVMALIPGILLGVILAVSVPQESYRMDQVSQQFLQDLKDWWNGTGDILPEPGKALNVGGGAVSLDKLGNRKESGKLVLTALWDQGGALYLRSCAYDTYYNNTWTNLAVPGTLPWPDAGSLEPAGHLQITTRGRLDMILTPYYPAGDGLENVTRGIGNYVGKRSYEYDVLALGPVADPGTPVPANTTACLQLPTQTQLWAKSVAEELVTPDMTVAQKADIIGKFVSNCAEYDLNPGKMPEDQNDFVRWFVERSDKGYCVHYATAATVLLRAAGVPARYVTGYLVYTEAGEEKGVYGKNAHAWTEYWIPDVGWVMLEPTPAGALAPPEPEPEPEQAPQTTGGIDWSGWQLQWLWMIPAAVAVGMAVYFLARRIRRQRRRRSLRGTQLAMALWSEYSGFMAALEKEPDGALYKLAERARFSPHGLRDGELDRLQAARDQAQREYKGLPLHKRLKR